MPRASEPELGVTAVAGLFPGARDVRAFWDNLYQATVAPLVSLERLWNVPRDRYLAQRPGQPDRTYLDAGFCIEDDSALVAAFGDRQVAAGRAAVSRVLAELDGRGGRPAAQQIALVVATSWSAPSFFSSDAAMTLSSLGQPLPDPRLRAYDPEAQLDALADQADIAGERIAVDSACASSLYALDLALGLLREGRAQAVVLLGLCVGTPLYLYVGLSKLQALAPSGVLKPFFADATGMVPGECAGAVVLERVDAGPGQQRVRAIVRGLGLSADGADRSIFAPSAQGQALAYQRAYVGLDPGSIDYIETHGTGTPVGDAAELRSLERFFAPHFASGRRLPIGSVKALIGHTLSAAGIASMIKGVLMLQERTIVPHILGGPTNPILAETPFDLPTEATPWPVVTGRPARIGISCFGFGGANAHLVLEAPMPERALTSLTPRYARSTTKVAIMGLELGPSPLAALSQGPPPKERFTFAGESQRRALGKGLYLPRHAVVDAAALRMGPHALGRLDPLQLLITELGRRLVSQAQCELDSRTTGVVAIGNLGGEMGCRFSRRFTQLFRADTTAVTNQAIDTLLCLDLTTEALSSSLPSMLSGFPAFHLDLAGFHETLAGGSGTFWTALGLAPAWLDRRCSALLLLATRQLVSPLDIEAALELQRHNAPPGELAGGLLLKAFPSTAAPEEGTLAVVHGVIPATEAPDWQTACRVVDVDPDAVDAHDVSELSPIWLAQSGSSEATLGYLRECSGLLCLARVLGTATRFGVIEIRRKGVLLATAVVERCAPLRELRSEVKTPLVLDFASPAPRLEDTWPQGVTDPKTAVAWLRTTSAAVVKFLEAQGQLGRLHAPPELAASPLPTEVALDPSDLRRDSRNIVIEACRATLAGPFSARLLVDETHPYFFDHPLDHVPGILLLAGLLELGELALAHIDGPCRDGEVFFVRSLDVRFYHFTEKDLETALVLQVTGRSPRGASLAGRIEQDGRRVATCAFEVVHLSVPAGPREPRRHEQDVVDDISVLHKRHVENVLITPLAPLSLDTGSCRTLEPPAGHTLSESRCGEASVLYLLEATRQATTQGAHGLLGMSRGLQMNLIGINLSLSRPCFLAGPLTIVSRIGGFRQVEQMVLGDVQVSFVDSTGEVGRGTVKSQAVDQQTYDAMRRRKA